jgi:hypothetical protein
MHRPARARRDRGRTISATSQRSPSCETPNALIVFQQAKKCTEPVAPSSDLPTDHRRSDNHSESHQPQTLRTRCIADSREGVVGGQAPAGRNSAQIAATSSSGAERRPRRSRARARAHENAPSRWRLRPAFRLTAAEAAADRRTINLVRSVLGASPTLGGPGSAVKASSSELVANCALFFSHRVKLRTAPHALGGPETKRAARRGPAAWSRRLAGDSEERRCRLRRRRNRKEIRRAGNAFVHLPDEPSASA